MIDWFAAGLLLATEVPGGVTEAEAEAFLQPHGDPGNGGQEEEDEDVMDLL